MLSGLTYLSEQQRAQLRELCSVSSEWLVVDESGSIARTKTRDDPRAVSPCNILFLEESVKRRWRADQAGRGGQHRWRLPAWRAIAPGSLSSYTAPTLMHHCTAPAV